LERSSPTTASSSWRVPANERRSLAARRSRRHRWLRHRVLPRVARAPAGARCARGARAEAARGARLPLRRDLCDAAMGGVAGFVGLRARRHSRRRDHPHAAGLRRRDHGAQDRRRRLRRRTRHPRRDGHHLRLDARVPDSLRRAVGAAADRHRGCPGRRAVALTVGAHRDVCCGSRRCCRAPRRLPGRVHR
jgi:hypothetical protein